MNAGLHLLTEVTFRHAYFDRDIPDCFVVEPTPETLVTLNHHGIVFKKQPDGFMLMYASRHHAHNRAKDDMTSLADQLTFIVKLTDDGFFNYTSIDPRRATQQIFYFHQDDDTSDVLHASRYVTEENLLPVKKFFPSSASKPFAIIHLHLNKLNAERYGIRFQEKAVYWRYLLVGAHVNRLSNPAILNTTIPFSSPKAVTLPNKVKALAFESEVPVPLKQKSDRQFQLVENHNPSTGKGKVVINNLPHPEVRTMLQHKTAQGKTYTEIII